MNTDTRNGVCGTPAVSSGFTQYIVGGQEATPDAWPWQVLDIFKNCKESLDCIPLCETLSKYRCFRCIVNRLSYRPLFTLIIQREREREREREIWLTISFLWIAYRYDWGMKSFLQCWCKITLPTIKWSVWMEINWKSVLNDLFWYIYIYITCKIKIIV